MTTLHPEDAEPRGHARRRVEAGSERKPQHSARVGRIDDAVIPDAGRRIIGMALAFVLLADWRLERFVIRRTPDAALRLGCFLSQQSEHAGGLLAAHDGDARVRPHPQKAWPVGASAHAVIAGTITATDDDRIFWDVGGGDRRPHFAAVFCVSSGP